MRARLGGARGRKRRSARVRYGEARRAAAALALHAGVVAVVLVLRRQIHRAASRPAPDLAEVGPAEGAPGRPDVRRQDRDAPDDDRGQDEGDENGLRGGLLSLPVARVSAGSCTPIRARGDAAEIPAGALDRGRSYLLAIAIKTKVATASTIARLIAMMNWV
jgi:hypothetical protein